MTDMPPLTPTNKVWIKLKSVTAHVPGPRFAPYNTTSGLGQDALPITQGNSDDIIAVPPGQPFEVDEQEAKRLLARHEGEYCKEQSK